ncbi:MAG: PTS glucose transporter subunit IIA [Micrococcaceae bacterium]
MSIKVYSPTEGKVIPLSEVPDPVFAQEMVGPGIAIDPTREEQTVVSPIDGTISTLKPHAMVIEDENKKAVLIHLGIDTVNLNGEGFELHAEAGDKVSKGDKLVTWNPKEIDEKGLSPVIPIIALDTQKDAIEVTDEETVEAGDSLLTIN